MDKSYVPPYTKCTQTGNPLMFITNKAKNIKITVPSVQSGTPAKIAATGTNIWDEQWELGTLNSDGTISSGVAVCSKNFIPVVAGETYVMIFPKGIYTGSGAFYDENYDLVDYEGTFPASSSGAGSIAKGLFTVPAGAHYMKFKMANGYGSTYNNNISINFPTSDLLYHQHIGSEHSTTVPSTEIQSVVGTNVIQNNLDADMTVEFACEDPKENSLTIMTYNVQYFTGLNEDETMQAEILDEYNASVISLQELRYEYKRAAETNVFDPRYWNMRVGNENLPNGIATNYGLSNVHHHFFTNQYSTEDKGYETAEMKWKGKTIFLISAHLTTSVHQTEKVAQMTELFNLVQTKETFILMGDFNLICMDTTHTDYINMVKPFVDAGYNVANCSSQHGFIGTYSDGTSSSSSFLPTDNIITSADFTMSNVRRDTIKIAAAEDQNKTIDHVALICELTL